MKTSFLTVLPDAVDVIVRGIKAGLPLLDSLKMVAAEGQEPVKSEFKAIIETQTIGLPLGEACAKLYERMPLPEANFFGIVIAIQQKAGGNLSEALGNLSKVLRERKKMKAKIQAMSMEAKASAAIIGSLPPAVMAHRLDHEPDLHRTPLDPPDRAIDAARQCDVDDDGGVGDEEDDQLRLLVVDQAIMSQIIIGILNDTRLVAMILAGIAAVATVLTLAMPLLASDPLPRRMKSVALEREKIRQRERERMARGERVSLRATPKQFMQRAVESFQLNKWVGQEEAREKLVQAGYRGHAPYVTYLFFRMVTPVAASLISILLCVLHPAISTSRSPSRSASACSPPISACICRGCF